MAGHLSQTATNVKPWLCAMGLQAGTAAATTFSVQCAGSAVQAPKAMPTFIQNVSARKDFTIEGIAKACVMPSSTDRRVVLTRHSRATPPCCAIKGRERESCNTGGESDGT